MQARAPVSPAPGTTCTRGSHAVRLKAGSCADGLVTSTAPRAEKAVVILPGLGNSAGDYTALASQLRSKNIHVEIANVSRLDWGRNALGLRYPEYWKGTLKPRPTVDWYLNKLDSAVDAAKRATRGGRVALLAHSAGGWLGRVYMRDFGSFGIESFTTLGAPHRPPPPGALDQTRGILTFCEQAVPGAFHDSVRYTTVAGKLIKGADFEGEGSIEQKLVGAGYAQICGEAGVWGDGIVPVDYAMLDGAEQVVLDKVYHSPLGLIGDRVWYGSRGVVDKWEWALFDGKSAQARKKTTSAPPAPAAVVTPARPSAATSAAGKAPAAPAAARAGKEGDVVGRVEDAAGSAASEALKVGKEDCAASKGPTSGAATPTPAEKVAPKAEEKKEAVAAAAAAKPKTAEKAAPKAEEKKEAVAAAAAAAPKTAEKAAPKVEEKKEAVAAAAAAKPKTADKAAPKAEEKKEAVAAAAAAAAPKTAEKAAPKVEEKKEAVATAAAAKPKTAEKVAPKA